MFPTIGKSRSYRPTLSRVYQVEAQTRVSRSLNSCETSSQLS